MSESSSDITAGVLVKMSQVCGMSRNRKKEGLR